MKKLKGFTIIELIVVLIISSILITLCLKVYTDFNKYFLKTFKEQEFVNKVMWFSLRMKDEINKADYITGNSEILTMYTSGQKSIYEFYPDKIIMQNQSKQITDTLFLTVGEVHLTYIAPKLINFIQFNYTYNGNLSFFYHHKTYSVRYLFDSIRED